MTLTAAPTLDQAPRADESVGRRRRSVVPYILILAAVAVMLVGMGYPVYWQIVTSFQKYGAMQQLGGKAPDFVGLQNYIDIATNPVFWDVAIRSVVFCVVSAVITIALGLLFALLMQKVPSAVRLIFQIALLVAWAMPVTAAMTVWIWLFDRRRGVVNYLLDLIPGVHMHGFNWIGSTPLLFFTVASVIVIWMSVPFVAFSAYAGLTQVSEEMLEATELDGATGWQRFRYILLPMLRPVIAIVLLLNLIWDLRVFPQITLLQDAGPQSTDYDLLGTFIYKNGVAGLDFGHGAAMSIFVLALTIALSWFYIRSLLKEENS